MIHVMWVYALYKGLLLSPVKLSVQHGQVMWTLAVRSNPSYTRLHVADGHVSVIVNEV